MLARSVRSNLLFNSARWIHRTPSVFSTDRQPGPSKQTMLAIDWQLEGLLPKLFKGSLGAFFQRMSKDVEFDDHIFNYKIKDPYNLNIHLLKMEDSSLENFNAEETAGEEDAANQPEEDKNLLKPSEKEVKEHLKDGTWKLKLWTNGNVNGFSILVQEDNKTKWRVCNVCNAVYSTRSTPSMRSHWANHSESRKDEPHEETLLLEAATKLVVEDGRSFRTIDTPSFKDYTSTVAKLAVQLHLKNRAFESIKLPTSYDVAKNLEVDYEKAKQEFRQKRLPIAVKNGCAITFDFSQESVDFAVATLHFLDNEWNITSQILEFAPFPLLQSEFETETGEVFARKSIVNIKEFFHTILTENGWSAEQAKSVVVVTDEARNLSFDNHQRCACHVLNTIAKRILVNYKTSKLTEDIKDTCKSVLKSLKRLQKCIVKMKLITILRETLGAILCVPAITRWLSQLLMVSEFIRGIDSIRNALETYRPDFLAEFEQLVQDPNLIAFELVIKPIEARIKILEGENYVTVSTYAPAFATLWDLWKKWTQHPNKIVIALATAGLEAMAKKRKIWTQKHLLISSYLDPMQKPKIWDTKCEYIDQTMITEMVRASTDNSDNIIQMNDDDIEDDFFLKPKRQALTIDLEMRHHQDISTIAHETDPLLYWKKYEQELPLLSQLAKKYFSIPASSSPSERAFSRFNFINSSSRNRLTTGRIQKLMYMQSVFRNETADTLFNES